MTMGIYDASDLFGKFWFCMGIYDAPNKAFYVENCIVLGVSGHTIKWNIAVGFKESLTNANHKESTVFGAPQAAFLVDFSHFYPNSLSFWLVWAYMMFLTIWGILVNVWAYMTSYMVMQHCSLSATRFWNSDSQVPILLTLSMNI